MNLEEVIQEFMLSQSDMGKDAKTFAYDQSLIASGLIDSFAVVEILDFLEKRFDIVFDPEDLTGENFDSIAAIAGLVRKRQDPDH